MKKTIQIDWLQINCKGLLSLDCHYDYKLLSYGTRVFKKVYEVSKNNENFCTIACCPLSSVIPKETHLVKIDNKRLYDLDFLCDVEIFIKRSGLIFKGISRLDLCIDFNYFDCNMTGSRFIDNFLKQKYKHFSRSIFKVIGEQKKSNIYDYLRFGSNSSVVSTYLYNKTKEMQQVKFKQHIFNSWTINDLNVNIDVWRLEFSIKSSKIELINKKYGDCEKLSIKNLKCNNYLTRLFYSLVNSYFSFAYLNNYIDKKQCTKLPLFKDCLSIYTTKVFTSQKDTNRSDKVFLRKLENYNNELRSIKSDLSNDCNDIKQKFIDTRRLRQYYNDKVASINLSDELILLLS